jgi:hypothetical protein
MAGKKIGELTPLGRDLISTDELELSLVGSTGSRKITGAQITSGLQPTLFSGTNIKTINSTSILGSGDLVVGGVGGGTHFNFPITNGSIYMNQIIGNSMSALTLSQFSIGAGVITTAQNVIALDISINVTGGLAAGRLCKICVYSSTDRVNWTLIGNSTDLDCSTFGVKTWTGANITFSKDIFYVVAAFSNSGSTQISAASIITYPTIGPAFLAVGNVPSNGIANTQASYVLPSTITPSYTQLSTLPMFWFKLNKL